MITARISGWCLMLGAVAFWVGWLLMPDAGTNDAAHILEAVRAHREGVWWSSVAHLLSGVALAAGLAGTLFDGRAGASWLARVGACLALIGTQGVCADAFFHLVAY